MCTIDAMPKRATEETEQISARVNKAILDRARKLVGGMVAPPTTQVIELALRFFVDAHDRQDKRSAPRK